jgi:ribosomal protein S18 acetylase RimI-like enzyme
MSDGPASPLIRPAKAADIDLLWQALAIASYEPSAAAARAIPLVAAHLHAWPRAGDFGVVAEQQGQFAGAAWARQYTLAEDPSFYVDANTPELSIGVAAAARGQGIGQALLAALIAEACARRLGLCLNVRDTNPAIRLYERNGFRRVPGSDIPNRVGGISFGMVLA